MPRESGASGNPGQSGGYWIARFRGRRHVSDATISISRDALSTTHDLHNDRRDCLQAGETPAPGALTGRSREIGEVRTVRLTSFWAGRLLVERGKTILECRQ